MVIGLTGPNAAGKGEVASYLASCGYTLHSLSDVVREEAARRGFPPERGHLIEMGNELRQQGGAGVLARRILVRLADHDVVDSIRNPAEVEVLRELSSFRMIGVWAPQPLRFDRSRLRNRPGDPENLDQFRAREAQENTADPVAQQLEATFRLADHRLDNDGDIDALHAAVQRLLEGWAEAGGAVVDRDGRRPIH